MTLSVRSSLALACACLGLLLPLRPILAQGQGAPAPGEVRQLPSDESPCFPIERVQVDGADDPRFDWLPAHADGHAQLPRPDPVVGRCLGAQGIQAVIDRLQHALIARGYITSRVLASPQDLRSGTLTLTLLPGQVAAIRLADGTGQRASLRNTVPIQPGDVLNLRDVEQALDNYRRVPTAQADIRVEPGATPGSSELVITHGQPRPLRLSATLDDSGTPDTGKYQGSLTLSLDNWWTLSDLFYVTWLHDLGGGRPGARGTRGQVVHYSIPLGYWLASVTQSDNRYFQTVAGASQDYVYHGTSHGTELRLARVLRRDGAGRTSASLKVFRRSSSSFIDDTEIEVQRRVVAGLEWGLGHRRSWRGGSLDASLALRRGTGAWGSLPAPEEAQGEGSSRMHLRLLDATVQQSFTWGGQALAYTGALRAQQDQTPLTPQDRFAIGGRHTVRGFDGLYVLSAERGWFLRNELALVLSPAVQVFGGVDAGHVDGPSAQRLVGKDLSGAVLGLRGQWAGWQGEFFVGRPLHKPTDFRTAPTTAGFSLSLSL